MIADAKGRTLSSVERARGVLAGAERVLIGAGAGLSTAAGLAYGGERFREHFESFIDRYGMTDMYSAGFYPFPTQEDKWAYWSQHIWVNRFEPGATKLYRDLFAWAHKRDCFVITTNVDAQFELAGFARDRIFATQGDYGFMQCARGCHERIYSDRAAVEAMRADTEGGLRTKLSNASLVPKCPVCGGPMTVHLRVDDRFVQTAEWYAARDRYQQFAQGAADGKTVLLELGVGWNTPVWIRFPFERMAREFGCTLVRMNYDDAMADAAGVPGGIGLAGDIAQLWPLVAGGDVSTDGEGGRRHG